MCIGISQKNEHLVVVFNNIINYKKKWNFYIELLDLLLIKKLLQQMYIILVPRKTKYIVRIVATMKPKLNYPTVYQLNI